MKRLNEITLDQFIDVSCGNYESLSCDNDRDAMKNAVKIIYEYKSIVNPAGVKAALLDKEEFCKVRSKILMYKLCSALCELGFPSDASEVVHEYDSSYSLEGEAMEKDFKYKARESEFLLKRLEIPKEEEHVSEEDIRSSFDAEVAFVMTYFKMPLDTSKVSAAVYANIVSQAHREIKNRMTRKGA